ncbi:MAG: tRNA (adenosine(37)-N6)-threonylcarbamoyltransferase complex dimerization subunit type 1 TsaB [Clostridia bacterium]|nr:tRNA (adenosine(37)-N6)-threonylcarbamoyltransferase complex dimerization subunit type 1 TsaB [Clostridia bacterium]
MKLLCIDTTKQSAVLALNNEGNMSCVEIPETKRHSEALLFELQQFLCDNNLTINDITHLAAVTGPGSFTGIRIGMATIKAFSFALNLPIVSANYFEIVSSKIKNGCVALKNTSTQVYFAAINNGKVSEIEVVNNCDVLEKVDGKTLYVAGCEHISELDSYKNTNVIEDYNLIMLNHFTKLVENKKFTNDSFAPTYAQLSQAERNLKD